MRFAYFQAKSRIRHRQGTTTAMSHIIGEVKSLGTTPSYSVENPIFGATVAYTGMKLSQMTMLPGIARNVYFVHIWVTNAALPSTVAKTAV